MRPCRDDSCDANHCPKCGGHKLEWYARGLCSTCSEKQEHWTDMALDQLLSKHGYGHGSAHPDLVTGAHDEIKRRFRELYDLLKEAQRHLDYCGYGDKWERSLAMEAKLPQRIEDLLQRMKDK